MACLIQVMVLSRCSSPALLRHLSDIACPFDLAGASCPPSHMQGCHNTLNLTAAHVPVGCSSGTVASTCQSSGRCRSSACWTARCRSELVWALGPRRACHPRLLWLWKAGLSPWTGPPCLCSGFAASPCS